MSKNGTQNIIKKLFFVRHFLMEFFGHVRENSGKDHSHPQNFACSYSYVLHHQRFRDFLECFGTVLGIFGVAFVRALTAHRAIRCHVTTTRPVVLSSRPKIHH